MSPRKKQSPVTPELLAATVARFGQALDTCRERWVDRWERPPRVRELVHAFEIVLAAEPEDVVCDPDAFEALWNPPSPPPPRQAYALKDFKVERTPRHRMPGVEEYTLSVRGPHGNNLEVFVMFEPWEGTLRVDYSLDYFASHAMTGVEAREVVRALALEFYLPRLPGASVQRVLLRPMDGLSDPVEVPLP